jgi:phosphate transport system permease protein
VSFMTGEQETTTESFSLPRPPSAVAHLRLDSAMRNLYAAHEAGFVSHYDIVSPERASLLDTVRVVEQGEIITSIELLLGTVSLVVGSSDGRLAQWFTVRDDENRLHLTQIREFDSHGGPVNLILPEYSRKGFITAAGAGELGVHYATSARTLLLAQIAAVGTEAAAIAPRNNGVLMLGEDGQMRFYPFSNPHPQVSLGALWNKVWYEGRGEPDFVWQSSSATDEFESKFSLVPLSLGTIKAAFYAMLFAMPLAIMGAIFTAYFMPRPMREIVKPSIEIMEALPTVVLGFLAGLWLAPFFENNLPAVFSILLLMPLTILATSFGWSLLPADIRHRIGEGWAPAILVPFLLMAGWICVQASPYLEIWFFSGDMRQWLTDHGYTYDQRNALVVGVAMGFAVIPTIFSITEDAIFNVPKHLTQGSLALGATPWQTLRRVVLLTASAGIFSALMIGFGRAVGETMIVLMATGNSPIMNFNIFEGMRTLSANIAVELPETAVGSTHYRILFLAALVLFAFTFVINTIAELVRQRLRRKYGTL